MLLARRLVNGRERGCLQVVSCSVLRLVNMSTRTMRLKTQARVLACLQVVYPNLSVVKEQSLSASLVRLEKELFPLYLGHPLRGLAPLGGYLRFGHRFHRHHLSLYAVTSHSPRRNTSRQAKPLRRWTIPSLALVRPPRFAAWTASPLMQLWLVPSGGANFSSTAAFADGTAPWSWSLRSRQVVRGSDAGAAQELARCPATR